MTKNLSVMWKEYAASIGKSVSDLTAAEKRQAEYNGILAETASQMGDAAKYAGSYGGAVAALEANQLRANQAVGAAAQEVLRPFVEQLGEAAGRMADFAEQNPALVAGFAGAAVAGTAATAVFFGWKLAADKLKASLAALAATSGGLSAAMGWIGLIAGAVGGIAALIAAAAGAEDAAEKVERLNSSLKTVSQTSARAEAAFAVLEDGTASTKALADAKASLAELFPELVVGYNSEGQAILASNGLIEQRIALLREEQQEAAKAARQAAEEALAGKQRQEERAREALSKTNALIEAYEEKRDAGYVGYDGLLDGLYERQLEEQKALSQAAAERQTALEGLYSYELAALGELDEAQQLAAEKAMEYAAAQQMGAEEFSAYLNEQINDSAALSRARAELARREQTVAEAAEETKKSFATLSEALKDSAASQTVEQCVAVMEDWRSSTGDVQKASKELSRTINMNAEEIAENLGLIAAWAKGDEEAFYDLLAAQVEALGLEVSPDGVTGAISQIIAAANGGSSAAQELVSVLEQLGAVKTVTVNSYGKTITIPTLKGSGSGGGSAGSGKERGGGGGSSRQKAWEEELEQLQHRAALGEDVADREIAALERILEKEKLTTQERRKLEEQLYSAKQERLQKELDSRLSLYSEIAALDEAEVRQRTQALEELLSREELTAQERADTERELNELRLASDGDYLSDYLENLEAQLKNDQLSAGQRKQVWEAYTEARIAQLARIAQAEENARSAAAEVGSQLVSALRSKYSEARSAALDALSAQKSAAQAAANARIEAINAERDAQLAAIEEEISALDALLAAKKRQTEDENDQDALARMKASLAYEKDEYNRLQLAQQIARKEQEIADKLWERDISDQKAALKAKQEAVREEANAQAKALQEQLSATEAYYAAQSAAAQAYYDEKLTNYSLVCEALELMSGGHEEEMQALLERYNKENITIASALTQELYDTFRESFEGIVSEAERMSRRVQEEIANALRAQERLKSAVSSAASAMTGQRAAGTTTVVNVQAQKGTVSAYEVLVMDDATGAALSKKIGKVGS